MRLLRALFLSVRLGAVVRALLASTCIMLACLFARSGGRTGWTLASRGRWSEVQHNATGRCDVEVDQFVLNLQLSDSLYEVGCADDARLEPRALARAPRNHTPFKTPPRVCVHPSSDSAPCLVVLCVHTVLSAHTTEPGTSNRMTPSIARCRARGLTITLLQRTVSRDVIGVAAVHPPRVWPRASLSHAPW